MTNADPAYWGRPPSRSDLADGEVHLWRVNLDRIDAEGRRLEALLSEDEHNRAQRFRFERDQRHFIVARGALRGLLGAYLETDPRAVAFEYTSFGKPFLGGQSRVRLGFNVSHSNGLALIAVCRCADIGVDLEWMRTGIDPLSLAEHYFSPPERSALRAATEAARTEAFFTCWTRKEAYIKARGEGLSLPLDRFAVSLERDSPCLMRNFDDSDELRRWTMFHLAPAPGFAGALVVAGRGWSLRQWAWNPDLQEPTQCDVTFRTRLPLS